MDTTITEYNSLYPVYKTVAFKGVCTICEPESTGADKRKDFLQLDITDCAGEQFPYEFAGDSTSFYHKAGSSEPMQLNCDGMFLTTYQERQVLVLCELKSGFDTNQILHAKEQIVGTLLRLKAQISILQNTPDWDIHGIIASYIPRTEQLTGIKDLRRYDAIFSRNLYAKGYKDLSQDVCDKFYNPLSVPAMRLHYVGVPRGQQHFQVALADILCEI